MCDHVIAWIFRCCRAAKAILFPYKHGNVSRRARSSGFGVHHLEPFEPWSSACMHRRPTHPSHIFTVTKSQTWSLQLWIREPSGLNAPFVPLPSPIVRPFELSLSPERSLMQYQQAPRLFVTSGRSATNLNRRLCGARHVANVSRTRRGVILSALAARDVLCDRYPASIQTPSWTHPTLHHQTGRRRLWHHK